MGPVVFLVTQYVEAKATQYGIAAATTIVFYDVIMTLPREIELIWRAKPSAPKYLYLAMRYITFITMAWMVFMMGGFATPLNNYWCDVWQTFVGLTAAICDWGFGGALLTLRVYVLYKNSVRHSALLFGLLWVIGWLPGLIIASLTVHWWLSGSDIAFNFTLGACGVADKGPPYLFLMWFWCILFEIVICTLLIYKAYQRRRLLIASVSKLMSCLIVDGILYNVLILGLQIGNMVCYLVLSPALFTIGFAPIWAISMCLISRIHLHLRGVADHKEWTKETAFGDGPKVGQYDIETNEMRPMEASARSSESDASTGYV